MFGARVCPLAADGRPHDSHLVPAGGIPYGALGTSPLISRTHGLGMSGDLPPLEGLDLNLLVTLRAILRERSVTRAAQRLRSTQPTVSRALGVLRETFKDPLLVRSGRGMTLTPFAAALRAPLERNLSALDRLPMVGSFDPRRDLRTFRLLVPDVLGVGILEALSMRLGDMPNVSITVIGNENDVLRALLFDEVDLSIGALSFDHPSLHAQRIDGNSVEWSVVYGEQHPCWRSDTMDRDAWLDSEHLQLIPQGRPMVDSPLDDLLAEQGVSRRIRMYVMYLAAMAPILEQTALVTTLPTPAARRLVSGRPLRLEPHPFAPPRLQLRMVWHDLHHLDTGHRWLRDLMRACVAEFLAAP